MTKVQEFKLKKLGPFTLAQARALGISQQSLSKLVQKQKIRRLERGIFIHPNAKVIREVEFQIACAKFGSTSVIGGLSALFYYNLAEQVPQQTWVLVPPQKMTSDRSYRLIRTKRPLDKGIVQGEGYRIVSIERAVIEGLKLAAKIGARTAIKAARDSISQRLTTLQKIGKVGKEIGLNSVLTEYFESIVA